MELGGDPGGLAALQALRAENRDYLKFLLQEARTVFEGHVDFKAKDGTAFRLSWRPREQKLVVSKLG